MNELQPPTIEEPEVERIPPGPHRTRTPLTPGRRQAALAIAIVVDVLQWVAFPFFMAGVASPVDDVLDVVVALVMLKLVGFHWAFLPAFAAELVPFVDLVPSWTAAVWLATRGRR